MQILALATIKLSILFFYRRIFRGRSFDIASWFLIGVVVAWAVTFLIAILAACGTAIAVNFQTLGALKQECVNTFDILIALAVSDVAVDLAILVMPIPLVSPRDTSLSGIYWILMKSGPCAPDATAAEDRYLRYFASGHTVSVYCLKTWRKNINAFRAIACGITRMALFGVILGPACKLSRLLFTTWADRFMP